MATDSNFGRANHHPLDALRGDHRMVRQLFEHYFRTHDEGDKRDTGRHLLLMLQMHSSLEEGVFYPRIREAAPMLVEQYEHAHEQTRRLIEALKPMDEGDRQAEGLFRQLAETVLGHIEYEERELFPMVEQAGLDLGAIGHEMMALELRMVSRHARRPLTPGLRQ